MRALALFSMLCFLVLPATNAQDTWFNFGGKVGVLMPGQVYISALDIDVETAAGFMAIPAGTGRAFTAEFSFISQPAGGNGDSDVTFTPRPYLAIGFEFGK